MMANRTGQVPSYVTDPKKGPNPRETMPNSGWSKAVWIFIRALFGVGGCRGVVSGSITRDRMIVHRAMLLENGGLTSEASQRYF